VTGQVVDITFFNLPTDEVDSVVKNLHDVTYTTSGDPLLVVKLKEQSPTEFLNLKITVTEESHSGIETTIVQFWVELQGPQLTYLSAQRKNIFIKPLIVEYFQIQMSSSSSLSLNQVEIIFKSTETSNKLRMHVLINSLLQDQANRVSDAITTTWIQTGLSDILKDADSVIFKDIKIVLVGDAKVPTIAPSKSPTPAPGMKTVSLSSRVMDLDLPRWLCLFATMIMPIVLC